MEREPERFDRAMDTAQRILENLTQVRQRIAEAASRSGRRADEVQLVAVTKYVGVREARLLFEAGCQDLGESRPQQLWERAEQLRDVPVRWHMIGHLQRNKAKRTWPLVALLHSGDSCQLLEMLDALAAERSLRLPVLIEVNVSGDTTKHGFAPETVEPLLPWFAERKSLEIRGLMAMSGLESDRDQSRREFARLRELRDRLRPQCPPSIRLEELSMGMSDDYEVAIEEGSTIVRVGTALFEGVLP